jgi:SAM-dependent methyltransferase
MFNVNGCRIMRCRACGMQYADFDGSPQFTKDFYTGDFFRGGHEKFGYADYVGDKGNNMRMAADRKKFVEQYVSGGTVLDVGCAAGFFLEGLGPKWDRYGCEPCEEIATIAREKFGDRISCVPFEQYQPEAQFDVITLWDSLEHVVDPNAVLAKAATLLKEDGFLFVGTPDAGSPAAWLLGRRWYYYVPPAHLFFFSRRTLPLMLNKHGFAVLRLKFTSTYVSLAEVLINLSYVIGAKWPVRLAERVPAGSRWNVNFPYKVFDEMGVCARKRRSA